MPTIDPDELAMRCVEDGMTYGVTPHYLMMAAIYLNLDTAPDVTDDAIGNKFRPYMFTQPVWDANCTGGDFDLPFLPADVTDWNMQCSVFAAMARLELNKLEMNAAGTRPSARELFLVQMGKMAIPASDDAQLTAALDLALSNTRQEILTAAGAVLDPVVSPATVLQDSTPSSVSPASTAVNLGKISGPTRQQMAQLIMTRFGQANYGDVQQLTAVANAIGESNLNPNAEAAPPENSYGLFQCNLNGVGHGHTPAQLKDPDTNIALIIAEANNKSPEFRTARSLESAMNAFVRKVEKPADKDGAVATRLAIARKIMT
jgi:hypothetical protein